MREIFFFLLCFIQPICLPIPEVSSIILGLLMLDSHKTFILGTSGIILGIITMYFLCIKFSKRFIDGRKKHIKRYRKYINKNPILTIGLLFTLPILPDEVVIIGAAMGKIPLKILLPIVILSKIVSVGMIAYSGVLATYLNINKFVVIAIELIIVFVLAYLYKLKKEKKI